MFTFPWYSTCSHGGNLSLFFSFYASKWSGNIIIIEFITFFIFFHSSQYFSFTLSLATHDILPPHKTWNFLVFSCSPRYFPFFAFFLRFFLQYLPLNVCSCRLACGVEDSRGKHWIIFLQKRFMIQEVLTHHFPPMRMGLKAILGKKRTRKSESQQPVRLSLGDCSVHLSVFFSPKFELVNKAIKGMLAGVGRWIKSVLSYLLI